MQLRILASIALSLTLSSFAEEDKIATSRVTLVLAGEKERRSEYPTPTPPKTVPKSVPLPDPGGNWILKPSFSDEFAGAQIDQKKWTIRGDQKRANGFWLKKNAKVDGKGFLHLTTTRDVDGEKVSYAGGAMESKESFQQVFGYFECRAKLQRSSGDGYHCSFWLQSDGTGNETDAGRNGTEIDVIEKFKKDGKIQHALHWDGYKKAHAKCNFSFPWPGIADGFHIFAVLWTPEEYIFYIDGIETWRSKAGGVSQVPGFIRLTTEFSQGWNGDIAKAKQLPDSFIVDYVRAWSLEKK